MTIEGAALKSATLSAAVPSRYISLMSGAFSFLIPLALVVVVAILAVGVTVLVRGGGDRRLSNKLMQYRVLAQAVAIILILLAFYLGGK
jgi:hypothetical protein